MDAARLPRSAADETATLELDYHPMNRGWRDSEEGFHVGFGWWAAVEQRVVVDESKILALLVGEFGRMGDRQADALVINGSWEPR